MCIETSSNAFVSAGEGLLCAKSITSVYQPIVDLRVNKVDHAESLARISHPDGGSILISVFLIAAVLDEIGQLQDQFDFQSTPVSVNVTANSLMQDSFIHHAVDIVNRRCASAGWSLIEVPFSLVLQDPSRFRMLARTLNDEGLRIVIDNFIPNWESLELIEDTEFHRLKIALPTISVARRLAGHPDSQRSGGRGVGAVGIASRQTGAYGRAGDPPRGA